MAPGGEADRGSQRRRRTPGDAAIPSTSPGLYPGPVPASGTSSRTAWLPSGGQARGRHHAERHGWTKIPRGPAVISTPLWGVSHVALRAFELRGGRVILSGVSDASGSCVTHVTCLYPLVAAAFESWPRPERHVSDMSLTQNCGTTRAYSK